MRVDQQIVELEIMQISKQWKSKLQNIFSAQLQLQVQVETLRAE